MEGKLKVRGRGRGKEKKGGVSYWQLLQVIAGMIFINKISILYNNRIKYLSEEGGG